MLLGVLVVPVDLELLPLARAVLDGDERRAVLRDRDDLAVLDQLDVPRLAQERSDGRGEEHLPLADADDERALQACANEHLRVLAVDHHEREVAVELRIGLGDGVGEVPLVIALDKVRDDLRVRLRGEGMALFEQRILELPEVLDDPVEDDRDLVLDAAP